MFRLLPRHDESRMNATTIAMDLAKSIFVLAVAVADGHWRVIERQRLARTLS